MTIKYSGDNITFSDNSIQNTAATGFGFKNRIINGAMMIDQRNAGASVTPTTTNIYTLDRWQAQLGVSSKYSVQQNAGSVTPPPGYANYLGITSLSAYAVGPTDYFAIRQIVEGFNTADLAWGTANAQPITLSFWVRSSLTGTFGGYLNNASDALAYPFAYIINSANTWEQKTITIAGPTSGTWNTGNGQGIKVGFSLGMGSTLSATAGSWIAGNYLSSTGATSVVGTNGATFYITGVQLEKGSTATQYDYRPYSTELALCQRYFEQTYIQYGGVATNTYNCDAVVYWVVDKRSAPSLAYTQTALNAFPSGDPTTRTNTVRYLAAYKTANATTNGIWAYTLNASAEL